MYYVLKMICVMLEKNSVNSFNAQDLKDLLDLCDKAVSNNLTRLVKIGFLVKEKYELEKGAGHRVRYRLKNDDVREFIRNNLY